MMEQSSFGYWLKLRRKSLDLTREGLADRVGCSVSTIRKLEEEERRPSAQIAERLAEIFNIPQNEQKKFYQFARGNWQLAPSPESLETPWHSSALPHRSNLPAAQTSLIGREDDIASIHHYLINPAIRLVTLIGPPGIGKTRLSIESASRSLVHFPDGVFFVELAPLGNSALIPSAITQALGFVESKNQLVVQHLRHGIGNKRMLLVLDNCEHLVEDIADLATKLLLACAGVKILATSRERLRIPGEWIYSVPALATPTRNATIRPEEVLKYPALLLFVERARAVRSDFALNAGNVQTIASICAHLDGLPLAIELIATQIHWMSVQMLLERLNDQLILSSDGMRAVPMRQRSLTNVIHWSYHLLSQQEQKIFGMLSVFAGGFTLDMAEETFSKKFPEMSVTDLIRSLTDKSLLQQVTDERGLTRYIMLETIQRFALKQLQQTELEAGARQEHLTYFIKFTRVADRKVRGPFAAEWADRVENEYHNIRGALEWSVLNQDAGSSLRLLGALGWLWQISGHFDEARHWMNEIRNLSSVSNHPMEYTRLLNHIGRHSWTQERMDEARILLEESQSICKSLGEEGELTLAEGLNWLGLLVLTSEGDIKQARLLIQRSLELYQKWGSRDGEGLAIFNLGIVESRSDNDDMALSLLERSLSIFRQSGDLLLIARVSRYSGNLYLKQGLYEKARWFFEEHLRIDTALKFWDGIGHAYGELGNLSRYQGNFEQAEEFYRKSLQVHYDHGLEPDIQYVYSLFLTALHRNNYPLAVQRIMDCINLSRVDQEKVSAYQLFIGMAAVAAGMGQPEPAAKFSGMARTALEFMNLRYEPFDQIEFDRHIRIARNQLGDIKFDALASEGCAMQIEQAIDYAQDRAKRLASIKE